MASRPRWQSAFYWPQENQAHCTCSTSAPCQLPKLGAHRRLQLSLPSGPADATVAGAAQVGHNHLKVPGALEHAMRGTSLRDACLHQASVGLCVVSKVCCERERVGGRGHGAFMVQAARWVAAWAQHAHQLLGPAAAAMWQLLFVSLMVRGPPQRSISSSAAHPQTHYTGPGPVAEGQVTLLGSR